MNYIYDILLNFNKEKAYQFYEWSDSDNIEHIKKIPLFKVTDNQMLDIIKNTIKIDQDLISKIYNRTEMFNRKKIVNIPYAIIIGNSRECYAFKFNKYGDELSRSNLILDEKDEVLEFINNIKVDDIKFSTIKYLSDDDIGTRFERDSKRHLKSEIKKIYNSDDYNKMKYVYREIFEQCLEDKNKMYTNLINEINAPWGDKHQKLLDLFKLLNVKKQL